MMKRNGTWYTAGGVEITDPEHIAKLESQTVGATSVVEDSPKETAPPVPDGDGDNDEPRDNESKADAFKRLGNKRVQAALDKIRLIGNLSNRGSYEYTEAQIAKIEDVLLGEVSKSMNRFRRGASDEPKFEL